jgi:predicted lipoprotein with Yx(FWY)xxD motif
VANSRVGKIVVDSQGRTVYLFKADVGTKSACTGACAKAWPPLLATGTPTAGSGAHQSLVGMTTRSDGSKQVTYNGHPLYLFIKDKKPGQTNGQGVVAFGAAWFVLSPAGKQSSSRLPGHSGSSPQSAPPATPKPAAPPATTPAPKPTAPPATTPAPKPTAPPATTPAPKPTAPPAAKPKAPASNGIPQNGGGDGDSDNSGGPSDGDGNI